MDLDELDRRMAKEKCWRIKEKRPIEVGYERRPIYNIAGQFCWYSSCITVEPMTMSYETFTHLGDAHCREDINIGACGYSYDEGKASFSCGSREDFDKWLEKYSDIIVESEESKQRNRP